MNTFRILSLAALAGALSLTLAACSRDDESASTGAANALLDYVPADTPYMAANLEPLPADVVDAYLLRLQPMFDEMQAQLGSARNDLEEAGAAAADDPTARLALAVVSELDGKLSRDGLASLGLDVLAPKVAYGLGIFPVVRIGLADPELLRATIQRVLDQAQVSAPEQQLDGVSYWRIAPESGDDVPAALYVAILDDHVAAGVMPVPFEAELLPGFLGLTMPAASEARSTLAELNRAHRYTPYGSGVLYTQRMADEFLQPGSLTARTLAAVGEYPADEVTPECVAEIHSILEYAPRITAGTTEFSVNSIAYQYRVETPPTLAGRLVELVAPMPAAEDSPDRLLDLSFGMRFGAVRDFLRQSAEAIVAAPYQCEFLESLNDGAADTLVKLDQPMPPFVNNFRGLRVSLSQFLPGQEFDPASARGQLALHVEQPEMFVGMAQMFLPDLSALELKPGGDPVPLPPGLIPAPGVVAYAALSSDAIGLSVGEGEEATLKEFLGRRKGPQGVFLSASYDTAAYLQFTNGVGEGMAEAMEDPETSGDNHHGGGSHYGFSDDDDISGAVQAIATAARGAISDMADRSRTELSFGDEGLTIDGRMTFKP